jgi:hypothetical protein
MSCISTHESPTMSNRSDHLYKRNERFHVRLGARTTTVSVDNTLSILLSLQLGTEPHTPAAHRALRQWLQARLDKHGDASRACVSQWLRGEIAEALISPALKQRYDAWWDAQLDNTVSRERSCPLTERDRSL